MIAFLTINENDSGILSQDSVLSEAAFGKHIINTSYEKLVLIIIKQGYINTN